MPLFKRLEKKKKFQAREKDRCLLSFGSLNKKRKERKEKEISRINSTLGRGGEGRGGSVRGACCVDPHRQK
jgi:hypothetical protein